MKGFTKKILQERDSFRLMLNDDQNGYIERVEKITSSILKKSDCVAKNIDIALFAEEFEKSWQHTHDFSQIRRTLYKWLPVVFFYRQTPASFSKYYKDGSVDKFINHCIEHDDERSLRRIYSELLIHYPQDERMYKLLALSINFIRSKRRAGARMLLDSEKQLELSTRNAPLKTATLFVGNFNETTHNFFDNLWLREDHLKSGFGGAVLNKLCFLTSKYLQKNSRKLYLPLIYFIENICPPKNVVEKDMIMNSLLLPFSDTDPDSTSKTEITSFADRFLGDPRLSPNEWLTVPKSREIYLRWKIGQTIGIRSMNLRDIYYNLNI